MGTKRTMKDSTKTEKENVGKRCEARQKTIAATRRQKYEQKTDKENTKRDAETERRIRADTHQRTK